MLTQIYMLMDPFAVVNLEFTSIQTRFRWLKEPHLSVKDCETKWQVDEKWGLIQRFTDQIHSLSNMLITKGLSIPTKCSSEVCASHQDPKPPTNKQIGVASYIDISEYQATYLIVLTLSDWNISKITLPTHWTPTFVPNVANNLEYRSIRHNY